MYIRRHPATHPPIKDMESSQDMTMARPDRKTAERNRRIHLKSLLAKLDSVLPAPLPPLPSRDRGRVIQPQRSPERLEEAVSYIKAMQGRMEKLEQRKRQLQQQQVGICSPEGAVRLSSSHVDVQDLGCHGLRVVLVSTPGDGSVFYEVVRVMEEEGAEIVTANLSVAGARAFHTIHTNKVADAGNCLDANKVSELLKKVIQAVC